MNLITLDFETFYDKKSYSLSKMTTEEYVRDERFEAIGVGVKVNDGETVWHSGDRLSLLAFLHNYDWEDAMALCQNTAFDAAILEWHFGVQPKAYADTMSMGQALFGINKSVSLKNMAIQFGIGEKGTEVDDASGKRRKDFTPQELAQYGEYCKNDVELTYKLFNMMLPKFTTKELKLIDCTIKMFARPKFELDVSYLRQHLQNVQDKKQKLLASAVCTPDVLQSNPKFAELLTQLGVAVPMKKSPTTGKETFAFAKTDAEFTSLLEHPNPVVQTVVGARLGTKSSIEETRTERFIAIGERGLLPIPLKYSGAAVTHRWSGFDQINLQNLPRGGALRKSIKAPKGYVVLAGDLSNIELRLGMWLAKQDDAVVKIANGVDMYRDFAAQAFDLKYDEIPKDSDTRFIAKVCCIAEGELVLTRRGLTPIEEIKLDDDVWDGVEWVQHDGVMYMGEREVITYDGLTATEDHKIWTEDGRYICFGQAASRLDRIATTGHGRKAVRFVADQERSTYTEGQASVCQRRMSVWETTARGFRKLNSWGKYALSFVRVTGAAQNRGASCNCDGTGSSTTKTSKRDAAAMHKSGRSKLSELRGAWYSVRVQLSEGVRRIYETTSKLLGQAIGRSDQQRWALSSGQSSVCVTETTGAESAQYTENILSGALNPCIGRVPRNPIFSTRRELRAEHDQESYRTRTYHRGDHHEVLHSQIKQTKRVYDIINAGPRHRFTVSGKLVSNCLSLIYGTGAEKLKNTIRVQSRGKTQIDSAEAERLKNLYRETNKWVVHQWGEGGKVLDALLQGKTMEFLRDGIIQVTPQGLVKPGGLVLAYPDLRKARNAEGYWEYTYAQKGKLRDKVYSSKVYQRCTQSLARDIIGDMVLELDKLFGVALQVHDEIVCIVPESEAESAKAKMLEVMSTPQGWYADLPLAAEAGYGPNYGSAK